VKFHFLQFADHLYPCLNQAIADTRRPLNDVTVWDIGHTGMAFLVTQAIGRIMTQQSLEHSELSEIGSLNTLFWRVLSVRTNGLKYLEEASTLADLRVRKNLLEQALERIQHTLEESLLAIKVYGDENGSFYIFPEFAGLSESIFTTIKSVLRPLAEIDGNTLDVKLSPASLVSHPKDEGGKYIGEFILEALCKTPPDNQDPAIIARSWTEPSRHNEICPACGIRPQGHGVKAVPAYRHNPDYYRNKAKDRNLCCLCMHRRSGVAKQWVSRIVQRVDSGTVWIDEVADHNGRVALIAGTLPTSQFMSSVIYPHKNHSSTKGKQFDHDVAWISNPPPAGSAFRIRDQGKFEWTGTTLRGANKLEAFQRSNLKIHHPCNKNISLKRVKCDFDGNILLEVVEDLVRDSSLSLSNTVKIMGADFTVVDNHRLKATSKEANDKVKNTVLWHEDGNTFFFVICNAKELIVFQTEGDAAENESFARSRRIWETTRRFWKDICPTDNKAVMAESLIGIKVKQNCQRIEIRGALQPNLARDTLGDYHAYDLILPTGTKMSVVWDPEHERKEIPSSERGRFITADNLVYLKRTLDRTFKEVLKKEETLPIEETVGYGAKNKIWGTIRLNLDAKEIPGSQYTPAIPILAEPRTFMALVPADKAMKVVNRIKAKYEREMGKVRNRLPLHLGIVYAHRRTPLRAILDAGRRMLDQKSLGDVDCWRVTKDVEEKIGPLPEKSEYLTEGSSQFNRWFAVCLENLEMNRKLTWHVPAVMGDGTTPDNWYPYVFWIKDNDGNTEPENAKVPRNRYFQAPNPWNKDKLRELGWLVHAGELKEGDFVYFTPATLDFQWLDSAGRRFEISYDDLGYRRSMARRPYLLDEVETLEHIWKTLKDHLSKNQIYILRDLIEAKREDWQVSTSRLSKDGAFWNFCRQALANAEWKNGKLPWGAEGIDRERWLNLWADYAILGWVADAVELHLQIMKEEV
jgi:CRISPR-associated Csx11 family protein